MMFFRLAAAALAPIRHSHQDELRKHWTAPKRRPTLVLVLDKGSDGKALANGRFAMCAIQASCRSRTATATPSLARSEEHTSELQSQSNLVCRLLLEKKK